MCGRQGCVGRCPRGPGQHDGPHPLQRVRLRPLLNPSLFPPDCLPFMLPYLQYPRVSALPGGPRLGLGTCQPEHSGPLREVPGAFWKRTTPTPNSSGGGWAAPSTPARVVLAWDPQELHPGRVPFLLPPSALCQHGHPCSWLLLWVWGGGLLSGSRSSPCPHAQHLCCLHNQFSGCPPRAKHVGSSSSPKRRQVEGALE